MRIRDTLVLAAGTLLVGAANIASAASVDEVRSVNVRYGDIELNTELGNTVLYRRIVSAAVQVCGSPDIRDLDGIAATKNCRRTAVERAVESMHSQRLAALIVTGDPLLGNPRESAGIRVDCRCADTGARFAGASCRVHTRRAAPRAAAQGRPHMTADEIQAAIDRANRGESLRSRKFTSTSSLRNYRFDWMRLRSCRRRSKR